MKMVLKAKKEAPHCHPKANANAWKAKEAVPKGCTATKKGKVRRAPTLTAQASLQELLQEPQP